MKFFLHAALIVPIMVLVMESCKDAGTEPPPPPANPPAITSLVPDSAAVGDTIRVLGRNFGSVQGPSTIVVGGRTAGTIFLWSDTEIRAEVPLLATTDSVRVTVDGQTSAGSAFKARLVSFAQSVGPVLQSYCISCHGGQNNLFLDSYGNVMKGTSLHGPVVTPGNGEGSIVVQKLRGTAAFGARMPQGGPYLKDGAINKISTWIQQGAMNN